VEKLAALFERYPRLCRDIAIRASRLREIAPERFDGFIDDLLQGAFLRIWAWLQNEPDFYAELCSDEPIPRWFTFKLYYACLDEHQRESHLTPRQLDDDDADALQNEGKSPHAMLTDKELWETVRRVLDDRDRRIVEMRIQGHKLQGIADEFGVSQTRIRQLYMTALERLRNCLTDWSDINLQDSQKACPLLP
jgi:RNA polymerase sigma factor (sigma-70 family)